MRKAILKDLAKSCASSEKLSNKVVKYILDNLTKQDLKIFLSYYKTELDKKRVYVTASSTIDKDTMIALKNAYKGLDLEINYDKSVGAGIKIQQNDMIVDFTFKKYIEDTIEKLK